MLNPYSHHPILTQAICEGPSVMVYIGVGEKVGQLYLREDGSSGVAEAEAKKIVETMNANAGKQYRHIVSQGQALARSFEQSAGFCDHEFISGDGSHDQATQFPAR